MNNTENISLEKLTESLQGCDLDMPLSKFVKLNLPIFNEFKKFGIPMKVQAEIVEKSINKTVSVSSLAVAISRLSASKNISKNVVIMEKKIPTRFVNKEAKLTLGSQFEKKQIIKNGVVVGLTDVQIDWRGIAPDESVSSWIFEYKDKLIAINKLGWRWAQIAEAITKHLSLKSPLAKNTLTSVVSIANKKITEEETN